MILYNTIAGLAASGGLALAARLFKPLAKKETDPAEGLALRLWHDCLHSQHSEPSLRRPQHLESRRTTCSHGDWLFMNSLTGS